ncbi:MAG: YraN family protein [Steroidobacteraceae bacterium]
MTPRPAPGVIGAAAEHWAARWLESQGARIVLRNFRRRRGELDLVIEHGGALAIVEVRLRNSTQYGGAAASVGLRKQRRLVLAAQQLLQSRPDLARWPVRFDVLAMQPPSTGGQSAATEPYAVEWIRHAFTVSA